MSSYHKLKALRNTTYWTEQSPREKLQENKQIVNMLKYGSLNPSRFKSPDGVLRKSNERNV